MSVSFPQFLVIIVALFAGEVAAMTFCFIYQGKVNQEPSFMYINMLTLLCI